MTVSPPPPAVPASIGRRVAAYAIDVAIASGVLLVGAIASAVIVAVGGPIDDPQRMAAAGLIAAALLSVLGLGWSIVYTAMQGGRGSIGQRALGLRLTRVDGTALGFWGALLRNVVFGLACTIFVGYFTPLFDSTGRHRGWHDLAAGALVIDRRATDAAVAARASAPAAAPVAPVPEPVRQLAVVPPPPSFMAGRAAFNAGAPAAGGAGMIAIVPGITIDPADAAAERLVPAGPASLGAPAPSAPVPAAPDAPAPDPVAPDAAPGAAASVPASDDAIDATRSIASVRPPAERAALYAGAPVLAVLNWDDGSSMAVYGRTFYGRNPSADEGAVAVALRDETLSLSKTHFEIGGAPGEVWVADRHSTNGTVLVRDGGRHTLAPESRTPLRAGDRLEFGDRSVTVSGL